MSVATLTGALLIALPLLFNVCFGLLAARFDYPDILRRPTGEVLQRFAAGGSSLVLLWWAFALSAVLLVPAVVLLGRTLHDADPDLVALGVVVGVLAGSTQALGLVRWPFAVPQLARMYADEERRAAVDVTFQALNRLLGVGVGEHLGYLLTGCWTALAGIAITQSDAVALPGVGWAGVALAPLFALGSLEFVGRAEPLGWTLAGRLVPVAYVAWSLWLAVVGVLLLAG